MSSLLYREMEMTSDMQSFNEPEWCHTKPSLFQKDGKMFLCWVEYDMRGMYPIVNKV